MMTLMKPRLKAQASLAVALALGGMGGVVVSAPALAAAKPPAAPATNFSKPFIAAAGPFQKALEAVKVRPDVVAASAGVKAAEDAYQQATAKPARDAAKAQLDTAEAALVALLDPQIKMLDAATAAASTPDDKLVTGQMTIALGGLARDTAMQRRGVQLMIDSGKAPADQVPKLQFYAGQFALQAHDYAGARTSLTAAVGMGYHENDADALLAEAYLSDNQAAQGLIVLQTAIDQAKAAGRPVPEQWYRRGLGVAYNTKQLDKGTVFAMGLVQAFPTKDNWAAAIDVLRDVAHFPPQEELDLMRLMQRTHSFAEQNDFVEYVQSADARRLPGEVKMVIDEGFAMGKLSNSSTFIVEARALAAGRIAADRATLPGLERDARTPSANAATVIGAADAFLSYGEAAQAAALYQLALTKPGVNADLAETRLGIAQTDAGDTAGALASFAKVMGPRKPMAQLWMIYAQQKAAGK